MQTLLQDYVLSSCLFIIKRKPELMVFDCVSSLFVLSRAGCILQLIRCMEGSQYLISILKAPGEGMLAKLHNSKFHWNQTVPMPWPYIKPKPAPCPGLAGDSLACVPPCSFSFPFGQVFSLAFGSIQKWFQAARRRDSCFFYISRWGGFSPLTHPSSTHPSACCQERAEVGFCPGAAPWCWSRCWGPVPCVHKGATSSSVCLLEMG